MQLSIIIVHWNTPAHLRQQLELLKELPDAQVIVVDNASTTPLELKGKEFANILLLRNPLNKGFAAACNLGTVHAAGDWLLFLNPDTHISVKDIQGIWNEVEKQHLDAASANLGSSNYVKPIPSLLSLVAEFTPLRAVLPLGIFPHKTLPGGCLFIKKHVLEILGGWDERFFMWFEDSDLSKRLLDQHYRFGIVKDVTIPHEGGVSFRDMNEKEKKELFFHSLQTYAQKHFSRLEQLFIRRITSHYIQTQLLPSDPRIEASIVVPNAKRELLVSFLAKNVQFFAFSKQELIVVTSVRDIEELRKKYLEVIFIQIQKNHGFAATVNTGLRRARGKFVGTVNDDTILSKDSLRKILDGAAQNTGRNIASFSPVIYNASHEIESAGISILPFGRAVPVKELTTVTEVDAFNGAAVVFNRQVLEKFGLFDEKFGSYLEDIDLGLRFKNHGWKNVVVEEAKIIHVGHQTSESRKRYKAWLDVKNWWLVMLKNYSISHWFAYLPQIALERGRNIAGLFKQL